MRINSPYWAAQPSRGQRGGPVPFSVRSTERYLVPSSKDRTCHQARFLEEKLNKNIYKINHNFHTIKIFKGIINISPRINEKIKKEETKFPSVDTCWKLNLSYLLYFWKAFKHVDIVSLETHLPVPSVTIPDEYHIQFVGMQQFVLKHILSPAFINQEAFETSLLRMERLRTQKK